MISASRSYQTNVEVMNTAKSLLHKTLQLGQADAHAEENHHGRQRTRVRPPATSPSPRRLRPRARATPPPTADRFLTLLVAQLQNQDPLNPLDNAQVTTQLAQISTVSGINKLNDTVQGLSSQLMQPVPAGREPGRPRRGRRRQRARRRRRGRPPRAASSSPAPPTPSPSRSSTPSGNVVRTLDLGAEGRHALLRLGRQDRPATQRAAAYTFAVTATAGGNAVTFDAADAATRRGHRQHRAARCCSSTTATRSPSTRSSRSTRRPRGRVHRRTRWDSSKA